MDLLIVIGRRRRQSAAYPVVIRLPDGQTLAATRLVFDPAVAGAQSPELVGELLEAALLDAPSREALGAELERTARESGRRILQRVMPPELFGLPWELILGHGVFRLHPDLILVRHRPSLDPLAPVPPTLPVDLLLASAEDPESRTLAEILRTRSSATST
jgi:hypothetical protein